MADVVSAMADILYIEYTLYSRHIPISLGLYLYHKFDILLLHYQEPLFNRDKEA